MFRWGLLVVFVALLCTYYIQIQSSTHGTPGHYLALERASEPPAAASSSTERFVLDEVSTTSVATTSVEEAMRESELKQPESIEKDDIPITAAALDVEPVIVDSRAGAQNDKVEPISPDVLNEKARSALVNILCEAGSPLRSTSGSGVIIDSRGIILTNAHVAQYFLLEDTQYDVSCTVRTGSPARAAWRAKLVFLPSQWVDKHTTDLLLSKAISTGEHDYAFLAITEAIDGALPSPFPHVPLDTAEAAAVPGDNILVAGYPAEFVGGRAARDALFASTVFSTITKLLTFTERMVDAISISGTALAQSGSSGGGFISMTGSLVGIVVTTSIADSTGARDLHAITPAHIERSIKVHTGLSIAQLLSSPIAELVGKFSSDDWPVLSKKLTDAILQSQH